MTRRSVEKSCLGGILFILLAIASTGIALATQAVQEAAETPFDPAAVHRAIDAWVVPLAVSGELSGTLLVARGDTVVYERAFGMANYELGVPNTLSTRYGIASITKPMTALVAIHLIETGKLGLHDPLSRWIPDFPRGEEITIEHLLRHQSGLPHRVTTPADEVEPRTAAEMAALAAEAELRFPPGSQTGYSSAGYSVVARVLELAGGAPYGDLLQRIVLAPAGAVHTVHPEGHELIPGRASSYFRGARGPIRSALKDLSFLVGAGSLFSTPRDIFAVERRLLDGGYGELARQELVRESDISWSGITNGFRAFASYDEDTGVSVVFAGNLFTGATDLLRDDLPRVAAGEEVPVPTVPTFEVFAVPDASRSDLEGIYQLRPGAADSEEPLRFEGEIVRFGDWILIPVGPDRFHSPQDYEPVRVGRTEDGDVTGLVWGEGDEAPTFPRVRSLDHHE